MRVGETIIMNIFLWTLQKAIELEGRLSMSMRIHARRESQPDKTQKARWLTAQREHSLKI